MGKEVKDFEESHSAVQVICEDLPISNFELHWESQFLGKQKLLPYIQQSLTLIMLVKCSQIFVRYFIEGLVKMFMLSE